MLVDEAPPDRPHFCLAVEDLDGLRARLEAGGVKTQDSTPLVGRPRFTCRDPFGNLVELDADRFGMTEVLVGLDVGTSGVKAVAITPEGELVGTAEEGYPLATPRPGWAEQEPEDWWRAAQAALAQLPAGPVGFSGQMHGLVALGEDDEVLRPAILWNDQRTGAECAEIERRIGLERLIELTGNRALTGFTAPKLLWLARHEPETYGRIRRILLPKDYVRLRLTGEHMIDVADASGTLLFDVGGRRWSEEVCAALEVPMEWLPPAFESPEIAGAGDQAAGALGVGIVAPGPASVVIGTSGVVFAVLPGYAPDPEARVHVFCHAVPGTWHAMGVMLSAAGSFAWLRRGDRRGVRRARRRGGAVGAGRGGAPVRAVSPGRADASCRPRRPGRLHGSVPPARPGRAGPRGARRRRLRAARLAGAAAGARRRADRRPRLGRRRAQRSLAADRRLGARPAARTDGVGGRRRLRRGAARGGARGGVRGRGRGGRALRPRRRTGSSPTPAGSRPTPRATSASASCTRG